MRKSEAIDGWHSRGYLPHFDAAAVTQMLTYRLADALPVEVIERCRREARGDTDLRQRLDTHLDAGLGSCVLRRSGAARLSQFSA